MEHSVSAQGEVELPNFSLKLGPAGAAEPPWGPQSCAANDGSSTNSRSLSVSLTHVTSTIILGPVTGNVLPPANASRSLPLNGEAEVLSESSLLPRSRCLFAIPAEQPKAPGSSGGRGCGAWLRGRWDGWAVLASGESIQVCDVEISTQKAPNWRGDQCQAPADGRGGQRGGEGSLPCSRVDPAGLDGHFVASRFLECCGKLEIPVSH